MVDRNGNGIPDNKERRPSKVPAKRKPYGFAGAVEQAQQTGTFAADMLKDPFRQGTNFLGDVSDFAASRPQRGMYEGLGDQIFGKPLVQQGAATEGPARLGTRMRVREQAAEPEMTLADYLRMATEMIGGAGAGVNYDPQRAAARSNAADADARLEAMYRQLRGSIDADAAGIASSYQQGIDATAKRSIDTQGQLQAATDAANSRNSEVLANLGIEQAQANQIQEGRDLNTQTAARMGDAAARGQASGDQLQAHKQAALTHNTNIGNAAGLEGNLQRAQNQAKLQALLAQIDMEEQNRNASARQNDFAQQLGLAQELIGFDRYGQEREDSLQRAAFEAAQNQPTDPNAFWQYVTQLQGINGLAPLSEDPRTQVDQLDLYRKIFAGSR